MSARQIEIKSALDDVRAELKPGVELVVVTKNFPISDLEILYSLGERQYGENRENELSPKAETLPKDINWHFQGTIQSNKLRAIVSVASYIHSLDELRHASKISELALEMGKKQSCFIQVNLDPEELVKQESNRSGIRAEEFKAFSESLLKLAGVEIVGVMGVAPLNEDPRPGFETLRNLSQELLKVAPNAGFISSGMSGDYRIAMEYGATHIRLGSSILGPRRVGE
ncbi:MAG: YggS family pyridoxal phosphate-dependent enzyme [Actinobacteria bacterium]|nr:YggS family pyridoxal phosphate-dependent enzyme [Actinomycetota bacterium]